MTLTDLWRSSEDDDTFEAVAVAVCPAQATRTDLWTSTGEHCVHGSVAVTPPPLDNDGEISVPVTLHITTETDPKESPFLSKDAFASG